MSETVTVVLTSGKKVAVGGLSWEGYCKLRSAFFSMVNDQLPAFMQRASQLMPDKGKVKDFVAQASKDPAMLELLATTTTAVNDLITEIVPTLVRECLVEPMADEEWNSLRRSAIDFLRLRNVALETCQFSELLELEKNFVAVAVTTGQKLFNTKANLTGSKT